MVTAPVGVNPPFPGALSKARLKLAEDLPPSGAGIEALPERPIQPTLNSRSPVGCAALPARLLSHPSVGFGAGDLALFELDAALQFAQPPHDKFSSVWRVRVLQLKVSQDRLAINPFTRRHTAGTKQNAVHLPRMAISRLFCAAPG